MYIKQAGIIEKRAKLAEGEIEFVVSTEALDAHGERIDINGISLKDFKKNPVVLWAHDGFNLPIGKATKIWKEAGKLMARAKFYMKDDFPRKVYGYIEDGYLNAVSIGGLVEEYAEDGYTISKLNMKEFSVVPVPANQEALVASKSLEKDEKKELNGLAKAYARHLVTKDDNELLRAIENQEQLLATLKELAGNLPPEAERSKEAVIQKRLVLKQARSVQQNAEQVIKTIKVKLKESK